jgi:serine protease Do
MEGIVSGARAYRAARAPAAWAAVLTVAAAVSGCTGMGGSRVAMPSLAPVVQDVMPAVVNVSAVQRPSRAAANLEEAPGAGRAKDRVGPPSALDELLRRFFDQQDRKNLPSAPGTALGSGFIIDPAGYIVTDDHVVENSDKVTVTFQNGNQYPARVIGRDGLTDLALLKIDAGQPLPYVKWGDSDAARVGDWVIAIGNPFGLDNTVSNGIISARGRDIHSGPYDDFLQIDAAINRGNSGGPTFDLDGNVIGINTAIYSPSGGSVGIGFAIPANLARPVVEQLREHGRVERGWLGVQIQQVTPEIAQALGLPRVSGALVAGVGANTPAARAGFEPGDVVLAVNGRDIRRMRDLPLIVAAMPVGQNAEMRVWRRDREITLRPVISQLAESRQTAELAPPEEAAPTLRSGALGLKLAPLTAQARLRSRIPSDVTGVVVARVDEDGIFGDLDLLPGDVIQSIDQQPVISPKEALARLQQAISGGHKTVLMLISRHGANRYVALSAPAGKKAG